MTKRRLVIIGLFLTAIVAFILFSNHGLISRWGLVQEQGNLTEELRSLRRSEDSLRALINTLENDPLEIERLARERYGYHRQGEQVYRIHRDTTNDPEE